MRIAGWSGPRNLSTAMMYSFGARSDFAVMDEPFYAHYLARTGLDHPMRDEILASQPSDPEAVISACRQDGRPHVYQKHMCHHMLPDTPLDWLDGFHHVFLIRHPARVLASYAAKRDAVTLDDIGFKQQYDLYQRFGGVIIDSADIRADPRAKLDQLCSALGIPFDPAMLHWPQGGHRSDGVWAAHWYGRVHASTGFAGPEGALPALAPEHSDICAQALEYFDALKSVAI